MNHQEPVFKPSQTGIYRKCWIEFNIFRPFQAALHLLRRTLKFIENGALKKVQKAAVLQTEASQDEQHRVKPQGGRAPGSEHHIRFQELQKCQ